VALKKLETSLYRMLLVYCDDYFVWLLSTRLTDRHMDEWTELATAIRRSNRSALKAMCEVSVEFVKQASFEPGVDELSRTDGWWRLISWCVLRR